MWGGSGGCSDKRDQKKRGRCLYSGQAKQGKGRWWEEKQGEARGGLVASEHQAVVQTLGWAIWRLARRWTPEIIWSRSILRTMVSDTCPRCGRTRGSEINHSSSWCLIPGGQGFEECVFKDWNWISPKFAGTLQLCLRTCLWNSLEIYFWAQGFITRVRNWVEVCGRLTLDTFHVWEKGKEYF